MIPYVFHCSKCRFPHAGECITSNPCREICLTCPAGFCSGHPKPTVSSHWQSRMLMHTGQTLNSRWEYVVREIDAEGVRVAGYDGYGHFRGDRVVSASAWTSEGAEMEDSPGRTHRLWMMPK